MFSSSPLLLMNHWKEKNLMQVYVCNVINKSLKMSHLTIYTHWRAYNIFIFIFSFTEETVCLPGHPVKPCVQCTWFFLTQSKECIHFLVKVLSNCKYIHGQREACKLIRSLYFVTLGPWWDAPVNALALFFFFFFLSHLQLVVTASKLVITTFCLSFSRSSVNVHFSVSTWQMVTDAPSTRHLFFRGKHSWSLVSLFREQLSHANESLAVNWRWKQTQLIPV